jgi:hypothetical protein
MVTISVVCICTVAIIIGMAKLDYTLGKILEELKNK